VAGTGTEIGRVSIEVDDSRLAGGTIPELHAVITPGPREMRFSADGRFADLDVGAIAGRVTTALTGSVHVDGAVGRTASGFAWEGLTLDADVRMTDGMVSESSRCGRSRQRETDCGEARRARSPSTARRRRR
jgi:hypothetical protein